MATDKTTTPTPRTLKMWFNVEKVNTECDLVIDGLDDSGKFIYVPFTNWYSLTNPEDMHRLFTRDLGPGFFPYGFAAGTFELEQWYIQIAFRPIDRVIDKRNRPSVVYMTVVGDGVRDDGIWDVPVDPEQVRKEYCRAFQKFYKERHEELAKEGVRLGEDDFWGNRDYPLHD
ncbi:MAG: hypothetical protein Q4B27_01430 [Candidatus Saccharibacteria bacterium]|nr:hypothetical protein [Candidatus Saccharibacteria bacterium]